MGKRKTSRTVKMEEVVTVLEHAGAICWRLIGGRWRAKVIFELDELEREEDDVRWTPVLRVYCHDPVGNRTIVEYQVSREYFKARAGCVEG